MFISIVSHGHGELIKKLGTLQELGKLFQIIVTDNVGEAGFEHYCKTNNFHYLKNNIKKGFGENNNQNFSYAVNELNMNPDDCFLVLNPDVIVSSDSLIKAKNKMIMQNSRLATINLVKEKGVYDANVRNFPVVSDFFESYLYRKNKTIIDKSKILDSCYVDWASGSFLLFKSSLYQEIKGFDEKFFMYCEDLDICKRAFSLTKEKVLYIADVEAFHIAAHNNRKIFSKHFYWHVKSVLRYCFIAKY
jgi:hypothetical protein